MAISFSRPDPSSPAAVADASFPTSRRGFDQQEVREFLRVVAAELARSQERERYLEQELRARRVQAQPAGLPAELDDETASRLLGEETTRILQAARESATAIRNKAEEVADRLLRDAREEAQRLREDAELEASRRRKDAEVTAESELESAKQQGKEMVDEARAYREKALGELARRRDLARQQIDQLIHGRERLVQAFERARLAAADVVAELAPLGELDEYVNLTPTTGPVPVMVPVSKLADASAISDDALALQARDDPADPALDPEFAHDGAADGGVAAGLDRGVAAAGPDGSAVDTAGPAADPDIEADSASTPVDAPATGREPRPEPATVGRNATVLQFPTPPGATAGQTVPTDQTDQTDQTVQTVQTDQADQADTDEPGADVVGPEDAVGVDDEIDDDDVTASDVDDLFARLRSQRESPVSADVDVDVDSGEPTAGAAEGEPSAATPFERRDEALTPLIVAAGRKLKRVLADEQNTALDTLRRREPVMSLDELVAAEDEHVARYFDAVTADVLAAARAGADAGTDALVAAGLAPMSPVITTTEAAAVRDALRDDLIRPLRDRLGDRIRDGEGDNEAVTRSARAIYREWKTKHIDDQLDDLLRLAYARGALTAYPDGAPCAWIADPAIGACSDCEDNSLQTGVLAGQPFPTGHVTPPAHPGCRCLITPSPR